jgi:hypothetical protein
VSQDNENPLTDSSEDIYSFCKEHIFVRGLPIPSNPWPGDVDYPQEKLSEGIGNFYRHLREGCPISKKGGNLSTIPLKKLKVNIKIY